MKNGTKWHCLACGWVPDDNAQAAIEHVFTQPLIELVTEYKGEVLH